MKNFITLIGIIGLPIMVIVLIIEHMRFTERIATNYGIEITAVVALICLIYTLFGAVKIHWSGQDDIYKG